LPKNEFFTSKIFFAKQKHFLPQTFFFKIQLHENLDKNVLFLKFEIIYTLFVKDFGGA